MSARFLPIVAPSAMSAGTCARCIPETSALRPFSTGKPLHPPRFLPHNPAAPSLREMGHSQGKSVRTSPAVSESFTSALTSAKEPCYGLWLLVAPPRLLLMAPSGFTQSAEAEVFSSGRGLPAWLFWMKKGSHPLQTRHCPVPAFPCTRCLPTVLSR